MSGLPEGWASARLDSVCDFNPKHDRLLSDEMPVSFVPMAAVSDDLGEITAPEERMYGEVRRGYTHFADGDVVWAKITPCMENGKSAVARDLINGLACGTTEFIVLRPQGGINPDYVHRYMRQAEYRRAAKQTMTSGVGQARVPKSFVESTELPLPPLPEQHRIVAKLDALQARSRAAKASLDEIPPLLDALRRSILAAAFRGDLTADWRRDHPDVEPATELLARIRAERRRRWEENELAKMKAKGKTTKNDKWKDKYKEPEPVDPTDLPELPKGWCWASVDELVQSAQNGLSKRRGESGTPTPVIRLSDVLGDQVSLADPRLIHLSAEELAKYTIELGDLLCVRVNGSRDIVGRLIKTTDASDTAFCDHFIRLRFVELELSDYAAAYLSTPAARGFLDTMIVSSAGQNTISQSSLRHTPIPLAPLEECHSILDNIAASAHSADSMQRSHRACSQRLSMFHNAILAKAFRGELVPQDPDDEPASALLDRIRAERAAAEGVRKKTRKKATRQKKAPATKESKP